jgi:hypothetical protein
MNAQAYVGYFENGNFYTAGQAMNIPEREEIIITRFNRPSGETNPSKPKDPIMARAWEAHKEIQAQFLADGVDMNLDEINAMIAEVRQEMRDNP